MVRVAASLECCLAEERQYPARHAPAMKQAKDGNVRSDWARRDQATRLGRLQIGERVVEQHRVGHLAGRLDDRLETGTRDGDPEAGSSQLGFADAARPLIAVRDEHMHLNSVGRRVGNGDGQAAIRSRFRHGHRLSAYKRLTSKNAAGKRSMSQRRKVRLMPTAPSAPATTEARSIWVTCAPGLNIATAIRPMNPPARATAVTSAATRSGFLGHRCESERWPL